MSSPVNIFDAVRSRVRGIDYTRDNLVNYFNGWEGEDWTDSDVSDAVGSASATIASLAAAIQALQTQQNNQNNSGNSAVVPFAGRANASSIGGDFSQTYSGAGSGSWGITDGLLTWQPTLSAPRTCVAIYNAAQTLQDYQLIGASFASAPNWLNNLSRGQSRILGRCNTAGTSYVYVEFERYRIEIGCVVSGSKTVWATITSGFTFQPNGVYYLECGTLAGARVFRVLDGSGPLLSHAEVGTTSQMGASYRYTGLGATANESGLGYNNPGRVSALAFSDNTPAALPGSTAKMWRTSTSGVNVAAGSFPLPNNYFGSTFESTADITPDPVTGKFTVSKARIYKVNFRTATSAFTATSPTLGELAPFPFKLALFKNGVLDRYIGDVVRPYAYDTSGSSTVKLELRSPEAIAGSCDIALQAGDDVQIGYDANAAKTGFLTGDAAGIETQFTITGVPNG